MQLDTRVTGYADRLDTPDHPPRPALPTMWLTALFLVALAGRVTFQRAGLPAVVAGDLRRPACAALLAAAVLWHVTLSARGLSRTWPAFLAPFTALIGWQLLGSIWAPWGVGIELAVWDLLLLWALVWCTAAFATGDPRRAARVLLLLALVAAVAYAVGGLYAGPGAQGRVSAFGGGPNVFVRVVALGMIAAVALAVASRRWWLLLPVPLLGTAAVLSGSRGGLVALVGTATIFFVFFLRRRRAAVLAGTLALGAAASWAVWQVMGGTLASLAASRYSTDRLQRNDYSGRPELLSTAWRLFREHPWFGAGMQSFDTATGMGYPHNYVAGLAAESGIVAVALLAWVVVRWCRDGSPWSAAAPEQIGCAVAAVYVLLASMFSGGYYDTRFCWIFAVVAVVRLPGRPVVVGSRREVRSGP
jgi:O-antigen ligase